MRGNTDELVLHCCGAEFVQCISAGTLQHQICKQKRLIIIIKDGGTTFGL